MSVVLPVLNGEPFLRDQLVALSEQDYEGAWELLVVDNGCSDRSVELVEEFAGSLPSLRIVNARTRTGLNHARNAGMAAARGEFLAFCDADDVAHPGWLGALVRAGRDADIVGGAIEVDTLNGAVREWRREVPLERLAMKLEFLPAVPGGNCGMWARVASSLRFDEEFEFGGSDIEFSWRAALRRHRLAFAPDAVISARHRQSLRELARQWYLYGRAAPHLYRRFRYQGMPPASTDAALKEWRWLVLNARDLVQPADRGWWLRIAAFRLGRLAGSARFRVFYP